MVLCSQRWITLLARFPKLCRLDLPHPAHTHLEWWSNLHSPQAGASKKGSQTIKYDPDVVDEHKSRQRIDTKTEDVARRLYETCPGLEMVTFSPTTQLVFLVDCFVKAWTWRTEDTARKIKEEYGIRTQVVVKRNESGGVESLEWLDIS